MAQSGPLGLRRCDVINLIITGTGRCGTGYVAKVLQSAGVACGHEAVFNPSMEPTGAVEAESSWLAAPHLDSPWMRGVTVVHLVRDPVKVINSLMRLRMMEAPVGGRYFDYIAEHLSGFPNDNGHERRAAYFYVAWNELIERNAPAAILHRVEEGGVALLGKLGIRHNGNLFDNTSYNTRLPRQQWDVDAGRLPDDLRDQLEAMARRYGYEVEL